MKVVIIQYNAGNIHSVRIALQRLGFQAVVTDDPKIIKDADKIIFPGVGEASSAMFYLRTRGIANLLSELKQPVLGICLGLQLMCSYSEENNTKCLGIFPAAIKRFPPGDKIPHIGWNSIYELRSDLFKNITDDDGQDHPNYVYFVHSYYAEINRQTVAQSQYILPFSAALQKDNFFAVQFHPEKSGMIGEQILKNFLEL
jgi:glutamine amidotransferase